MRKQQHGDVLLNPVSEIPAGLKKVPAQSGRLILAEGEATGHAHAITEAPGVELLEGEDGRLYLRVTGPEVELSHEEHATQTVLPGEYEVGQVVEVDPFERAVRRVMD